MWHQRADRKQVKKTAPVQRTYAAKWAMPNLFLYWLNGETSSPFAEELYELLCYI